MSIENKNKILVVEDSPVQQKIIGMYIRSLTDFEIMLARSRKEMLELIETWREEIFLAVCCLILPDAPYGETIEAAQAVDMPVIVLTASFDEKTRAKYIAQNVQDYFIKTGRSEMEALVRGIVRLRRNVGTKAIVVDNSEPQRKIMADILTNQMYDVLEAADGVEALELLYANQDTRLMLIDYQMPRLGGFELLTEVREIYGHDKLAVIGVSTSGGGPMSAKFLKLGADDFIIKPFEVEEFKCRVNRTMEVLDMIKSAH